MSYIIYKTTNTITGKYYIGVTNGNDKRYMGSGRVLKNAIKEYGIKYFVRETLEVFDTEEEAYIREAQIVNDELVADRDTYNIGKGGKGGPGQPKSMKHKEAIRQARLGIPSINGGRKPAVDPKELITLCNLHGKRNAAKMLGISIDACRSRYHRLKNKI